jgi:hypothetical protein
VWGMSRIGCELDRYMFVWHTKHEHHSTLWVTIEGRPDGVECATLQPPLPLGYSGPFGYPGTSLAGVLLCANLSSNSPPN